VPAASGVAIALLTAGLMPPAGVATVILGPLALTRPWLAGSTATEETEGEFAVRMNTLPKFVVSQSLKEPLEWNGTLLKGNVAEEVRKLKQESGQDILIYGSGKLVNSLMAHNVIDVYRLMVHPVVLGTGSRSSKTAPR
jgi:dihydrofolate reductase